MDLIAGEPFQPVGIDRFAKCLSADQWAILKFLATFLVPGHDLGFQEAPEALSVRAIGYLTLLVVVCIPTELLLPPRPCIIAQRGHCTWPGASGAYWLLQAGLCELTCRHTLSPLTAAAVRPKVGLAEVAVRGRGQEGLQSARLGHS